MRKGVLTNQEAIAQEMRVTQKTDNSLSKNLLQHARGFQESLKRHFPANQTDYGLCKQININFIYSFSLHLSIHCERISKYMVPCRTWYAYDSGVWRSGSAEAIELTRQRAQTQSAGPVLAQQTPRHSNILGRPGHDLRWG